MFDTSVPAVATAPARDDLRLSELCLQLFIRGAGISLGIAALTLGAIIAL